MSNQTIHQITKTKTSTREGTSRRDGVDNHPRALKSLSTALTMLDLFTDQVPELGITEIARQIGMSKAGVHRILVTLAAYRYVYQVSDAKYRLGLKAWEVGRRVVLRSALTDAAKEQLTLLANETGETAGLATTIGSDLVFIENIPGTHPVLVMPYDGLAPIYATASGKAILAYRPDTELILNQAERTRLKEWPPFHKKHVLEEIADALRTGYGVNKIDFRDGVCAVAAAVFSSEGEAIAALSLSGPENRFTPHVIERYGKRVIRAAEEVSRKLGYFIRGPKEKTTP